MASQHHKEGQLSKQEFYNVQAFSKSSYKELAAYSTPHHPASKRNLCIMKERENHLDVSDVDLHLLNEQLPAVVSRDVVHDGKWSATSPELKNQSCSTLRQYLLQVAKERATYPFNKEGEGAAIRNMMENAAENFCDYLRKNFCLFCNCELLKTGSTYEGVKIGKPDEFDFMIEVPLFASSDAVVFHQSLGSSSHGRIPYKVHNKALFSDIFESEASHFTIRGPVEQEAFMKVIFAKLSHAVETKFIKFLPAGWELTGVGDNFTTNPVVFGMSGINAPARMALTPCFVWHGKTFPNLKVTVDFAFAIPIVKPASLCSQESLNKEDLGGRNGSADLRGALASELEKCDKLSLHSSFGTDKDVTTGANEFEAPAPSADDTKHAGSMFCGATGLDQPESHPCQHYTQEEEPSLSLPDVFHLLLADFTWCRASFSIQEQKIMKTFDTSDGQKICMRLVKYLRNAFIAQAYDDKILDLKPTISTYWLKTIMYYMYEKYRNVEMAWQPDQLHHRVIEVFETLLQCLQQSSLYNFFVPNYNLLWMKQRSELETVMNGVESLLQMLHSLDKGEFTADELIAQECKLMRENQKLLYEGRKSKLLEMLLTYATYGTEADSEDDEELQSIHCFACQYLDGVAGHTVRFAGKGQDILFFEDGLSVEIGIKEAIAFLDEQQQAFEMFAAEENND